MRTSTLWIAVLLASALPVTAQANTGNFGPVLGWLMISLMLMIPPALYILIADRAGFRMKAIWLVTVVLANIVALFAAIAFTMFSHALLDSFAPWIFVLLPGYMVGFAYKFTIEDPAKNDPALKNPRARP